MADGRCVGEFPQTIIGISVCHCALSSTSVWICRCKRLEAIVDTPVINETVPSSGLVITAPFHSRGEGASQIARLRTYVFMSLSVCGSRLMPSPGGWSTKLG